MSRDSKATGQKPPAQDDPQRATALDLPRGTLSEPMQAYFAKCEEKIGFVPHVLEAYAHDNAKLEAFVAFYNDLMLGPSGLSKLEREMIAVCVSSANRCSPASRVVRITASPEEFPGDSNTSSQKWGALNG